MDPSKAFTVPNIITFIRILMACVVLVLFPHWSALVLFVVFVVLDAEGWLARKLGQVTELGAFLDSFADTLMIIILFFLFWAKIPIVFFVLYIISRLLSRLPSFFTEGKVEWVTNIFSKIAALATYCAFFLLFIGSAYFVWCMVLGSCAYIADTLYRWRLLHTNP